MVESFETWEQAYDACREANHPLMVEVAEKVDGNKDGQVGTVYPSGHWRVSTK